ncbi:hypothetical protein KK062_16895 [Fulvivirgaceae bacterium PWU5]|uniref:Lipoprotein n=1 Tax=Dawidia cretensis TaxID=2782350 RepID=A0AAP2DYE5_9BACT|nr:hypothetical protein [Dawidia cretensis]MBT1709925.1 hypothetical protein [Dawidia cretensis]
MNILLKSVAACLLLATLASCDYLISYRGFVLDSQTEKPIKDATVTFDKQPYNTDSLGYFEIHYLGGRPDYHFAVEKRTYHKGQLTIEYDDNNEVYKIEKIEIAQRIPFNSMNFKVTDDTLTFYLKKLIE